ncbi:MAG: MBL fold metallo-hydrolase [Anaerolineae bacterium]
MSVRIDPIGLGISRSYLLRGEGAILVDAGVTRQTGRIMVALQRLEVAPEDIRLIVLTHAHADHAGSAKGVSGLTRAPIAVHKAEHDWLEQGKSPITPGVTLWGRTLARLMSLAGRMEGYPPAQAEILLDDRELSLEAYGIPGSVLHTPGHTQGSVSILLESGEAIVGDLAMDGFPLRLSPGLPVLAENREQVLESWHMLLARGAKTIYPAHGRPFPAEVIRQALGRAR